MNNDLSPEALLRTIDAAASAAKAREWFCETISAPIESPIPRNLASMADKQVVTGEALFDWITTYRFRRRRLPPDGPGWDPVFLFVDSRTGISPNDIDPKAGGYLAKGPGSRGNGWLYPKILGVADFNEMKLVSATEASPNPR